MLIGILEVEEKMGIRANPSKEILNGLALSIRNVELNIHGLKRRQIIYQSPEEKFSRHDELIAQTVILKGLRELFWIGV